MSDHNLFLQTLKKSDIKIQQLLKIMRQLRHPKTGCQWDLQQTFESLSQYVIEEAYEVCDAVNEHNINNIQEELGDLLLQVVFFSQIAEERNYFTFLDVVETISKKMITRHPHVFSDNKEFRSVQEQEQNWEKIKQAEEEKKNFGKKKPLLSSITKNLPPLVKAKKIQDKVSKIGFDWKNLAEVTQKVLEELEELKTAIKTEGKEKSEEELGDLLFTIVNLARHIDVDPEIALLKANKKFEKRFEKLELELLNQNKILSKTSKFDMDAAWAKIKQTEKDI